METFFSDLSATSVLFGAALVGCGVIAVDTVAARFRKPAAPPPPAFLIADVIAVDRDRVTEVMWTNPALLTVDQARTLLEMQGSKSKSELTRMMQRLGTAVAHNPGRVYLVLIES